MPRIAAFLIILLFGRLHAASYFVSSSQGNDSANGTTAATAWKTLAKACGKTFAPGDTISLKRGDRFLETFVCQGNGTEQKPITLTAYGTGSRPRIESGGARKDSELFMNTKEVTFTYSVCIAAVDIAHWRFKDLDVGTLANQEGVMEHGILLCRSKGVAVENSYFHDLHYNTDYNAFRRTLGEKGSYAYWGTAIMIASPSGPGVTVRGCVSQRNDGFTWNTGATDMVIENCTVKRHPFNTTMSVNDTGSIIRASVYAGNGGQRSAMMGGTDIMLGFTKKILIEDCEIAHRSIYKGDPDGCALDYECNTVDAMVRRCDIHHSVSTALMSMSGNGPYTNLDVVDCLFRYNGAAWMRHEISYNNQEATGRIEGNTYYLLPGTGFVRSPHVLALKNNSEGAKKMTEAPRADLGEGRYGKPIDVALSCATEGAVIRYTIDGSCVTEKSPVYKSKIAIAETSALNAKAFKDGMERSYGFSAIYEIGDREDPARFANAGFEEPVTEKFQVAPPAAGWTFASGCGIAADNSDFGNAAAPEGRQVAFIQNQGKLSQKIRVEGGKHTLRFRASRRIGFGGQQSFRVSCDGQDLGTFAPSNESFYDYECTVEVAEGEHTIAFEGLTTTGDNTCFIDDVRLEN